MKLFVDERRLEIIKRLKDKKRITVKELAKEISVSEATLRADLNHLEIAGHLRRTHGGAVLPEKQDNNTSFSVRTKRNVTEKMKIAIKAFELIQDRQCIFLDASSTALELARYINTQSINLTVVTNGIQTAIELKENPRITTIIIGGVATKDSSAIEGTLGLDILDSLNIDFMFTSANGFSVTQGLTDFNLYEISLKRELMNRAKHVVALIDSSKIGKTSSAFFASLQDIDTFITDQPLEKEIAKTITENQEVEVIIAN
ncbi:DeoR/GlpR family DNA-binding transcription regulator [Oceanobacillus sp. CAU 1775]